jgi:hypothetical protein
MKSSLPSVYLPGAKPAWISQTLLGCSPPFLDQTGLNLVGVLSRFSQGANETSIKIRGEMFFSASKALEVAKRI